MITDDDGETPYIQFDASYNRKKECMDWGYIIPFVIIIGLVIYYGSVGFYHVVSSDSICAFIGGHYDEGLLDSPEEEGLADLIFDGCLTHLISGSETAKAECITLAIRLLVGEQEKRQVTVPAIVDEVYSVCIEPALGGQVDGFDGCVRFVFDQFGVSFNSTLYIDECIIPILSSDADAAFKCTGTILYDIDPTAYEIFRSCSSADTQCIEDGITPIVGAEIANGIVTNCLDVLDSTENAVNCLEYGISIQHPELMNIFTDCVDPLLIGDLNAIPMCSKSILEAVLGESAVLDLFYAALENILSGNLFETLRDECLSSLINDVQLEDFQFDNCLFRGLGVKFCEALEKRGMEYLRSYFNSLGDSVWSYRMELMAMFSWIALLGFLIAVVWMVIIHLFTKKIIVLTLVISFINLGIFAIMNFIVGAIPIGILILVLMLLRGLLYCCFRGEIQFVAKILKVTISFLSKNWLPFIMSFVGIIWQMIWCGLFLLAFIEIQRYSDVFGATQEIIFMLSFFWIMETFKNILAVMIASFVGSWYYNDGDTSTMLKRALLRSCVYSLGSVIIGSLLVALLKTLMYVFKKGKSSDEPWVKAFCLCIICCFTQILKTFNMYSFVQVAVYGKNYFSSSKETLILLKECGMTAAATDDLIDNVMDQGRGWGTTALIGLTTILGISYQLPFWLIVSCCIIAWFFGYMILSTVAVTTEISAATIFVLFSVDHEGFALSHPSQYEILIKAWKKRYRKLPKFLRKEKNV